MITISPLVSVIIPILDGEPFIDTCLSSMTAQTYENLEILCVANGCTDATVDKVTEWSAKDPRVTLHELDVANIGKAVNLGLDKARGELISFIDVDDWCEPTYIEKLYEGIKQGYRLAKCNLNYQFKDRTQLVYAKTDTGHVSIRESNFMLPIRHSALYDRSLFDGLRYLEESFYEDISLWPLLVERAGGVYYVGQPLYTYNRTNEHSIMNSADSRHWVLDKVFTYVFEHLTPDMDREINLLITALFIQSFFSANIQRVDLSSREGQDYVARVRTAVAGRLPGYAYMVDLLKLDEKTTRSMLSFYIPTPQA